MLSWLLTLALDLGLAGPEPKSLSGFFFSLPFSRCDSLAVYGIQQLNVNVVQCIKTTDANQEFYSP